MKRWFLMELYNKDFLFGKAKLRGCRRACWLMCWLMNWGAIDWKCCVCCFYVQSSAVTMKQRSGVVQPTEVKMPNAALTCVPPSNNCINPSCWGTCRTVPAGACDAHALQRGMLMPWVLWLALCYRAEHIIVLLNDHCLKNKLTWLGRTVSSKTRHWMDIVWQTCTTKPK